MIIEKNKIFEIDMSDLCNYVSHNQSELSQNGEPYKFYAYVSTLVNNKIILDVGSRYGLSALAFSYNKNNKVISYDLVEQGASSIKKENIEFKIIDFRNDESLDYGNIDIIMIDVDPHDGIQEREMYSFLHEKQWRGILLLDDISDAWFPPINKWWNEIQEEKYDVSDVAHFSGTGIVNFGNKFKIEIK